jgi:hypothetical protein
VRAAKSEVDSYVDPAKTAAVLANVEDKAQSKKWFEFPGGLFSPYMKAGKFQTFEATLIVLGDLVHWGAVQFPYPSVYTSFDADPKAAPRSALRVFKMAADKGDWVAGAHLAFPGIGHIRAGEGRYFWIPANYTIPQQAVSSDAQPVTKIIVDKKASHELPTGIDRVDVRS